MFLTVECDNAIRIIRALTNRPKLSVSEIAKEEHISHAFVQKILARLIKAKYVGSERGRNGGYYLARPASSISLWDIYSVISPNKYLCACLSEENNCPNKTRNQQHCKVHKEMARIHQLLITEFSSVSMEEIAFSSDSEKSMV